MLKTFWKKTMYFKSYNIIYVKILNNVDVIIQPPLHDAYRSSLHVVGSVAEHDKISKVSGVETLPTYVNL